jgi:phage tail-like protein
MIVASNHYPPAAFNFKVVFAATGGMFDTSFQDVSGIKVSIETEPYNELGENSYTLQLPKAPTYDPLVLKRGVADMKSPLVKWCRSIFEGSFTKPITPMPVQVHLIGEHQVPVRSWSFSNAYPISWEVDSFNSVKNEVAIETITLRYDSLSRLL